MTIKKLILSVLTAVCLAQTAHAVPAYPRPFKVTQADGTTVTVQMFGDERHHIVLTADGYPVIYNEQTQNYEYATVQQSRVVPSGMAAQDLGMRSAAAQSFLQGIDVQAVKDAAFAHQTQSLAVNQPTASTVSANRSPRRVLINNFPHVGEQHALVLLIQFSDDSFSSVSDPQAHFTNALNQEGFTYGNGANGSARDYFLDSSNGAFQPTFDVVGPITVSGTRSQYSQSYGMGLNGDNAATLLVEAVAQIDSLVDFSQYDHDGDGYVDNICYYFAGYGYADSYRSNTIWPHASNIESFKLSYTTDDGVKVGSYTCFQEIDGQRPGTVVGIGTFVHEFGHVLGLADHYDSANNGSATYVPGDWDVMASGSYNNDQNTPPTYSAFERMEMGWMTPTTLSPAADSVVVVPLLAETNDAYILRAPDTDNEYFLLENRQQTGWDEYLPGHGMLVWHVDMDEERWLKNMVNTDEDHQLLDIVEADGRKYYSSYGTASFPGAANVTTFEFNTWAGDRLFAFADVAESGGVVKFALESDSLSIDAPEYITVTSVADSSFTAQWARVPNATKYIVTVKTADDVAVSGFDRITVVTDSLTARGLSPETTYTIGVRAGLGSHRSDEVTAQFTTTAIPFEKLYTDTLSARDISTTGFTADWGAIRDAQSYLVTLNEHSYSAEPTVQGCDFTDLPNGLPESWKTNTTTKATGTGWYGEASPALRLGTDGHYLKVAYTDAYITGIKFWARGSSATVSKGSKFIVQRFADGEWLTVDSVACSNTADTYSYQFEASDSVSITFSKVTGGGYIAIDDVYADVHNLVRTPLEAYNGRDVGSEPTAVFADLKPETTYDLVVCGLQNGVKSLPSSALLVTTQSSSTSIEGVSAERDDAAAIFDLQGRRVTNATAPGVYLIRKNGVTRKVSVK